MAKRKISRSEAAVWRGGVASMAGENGGARQCISMAGYEMKKISNERCEGESICWRRLKTM